VFIGDKRRDDDDVHLVNEAATQQSSVQPFATLRQDRRDFQPPGQPGQRLLEIYTALACDDVGDSSLA
jgi:hypothetical protein